MSNNRLFHSLAKALLLGGFLSISIVAVGMPGDEFELIKIQADSAIHEEKKGLTVYTGQVILEQGSIKVEADKITVFRDKNGEITQLSADGKPAKFQQKPDIDQDIVYASANSVTYTISDGKIVFVGNTRINQGQAQLKSDTITYLSNQQIFKAQKNTSSDKSQRVEMIIPPKKKITEDKP